MQFLSQISKHIIKVSFYAYLFFKKFNLYLEMIFYFRDVRKNYFLFPQNVNFNERKDM